MPELLVVDRAASRTRGASGSVRRAFVFFCVSACYQWPNVTPDPLQTTDPQITTASVQCDVRAATWGFELETDAWTGTGRLHLSADGEYIEKHSLPSVSAAADGSWDRLKRDLSVVATWRDAVADSSTAFPCDTASLAGVFSVYSRDGSTRTDCVAFGEDPERWQAWDADVGCEESMPDDHYPSDTGDPGDPGDPG